MLMLGRQNKLELVLMVTIVPVPTYVTISAT
jgi:hypothetical protein